MFSFSVAAGGDKNEALPPVPHVLLPFLPPGLIPSSSFEPLATRQAQS